MAVGNTIWATRRERDSGSSKSNLHGTSGWTVRESGGTPEGVSQRVNAGEGIHHKKVGDPGKYNTGGFPRGLHPRGDDLD